MTEEDDAVQVALCLKGDASAFEPIVARYQKVLFNVALRMLGDREDARASEGFVRELSTPWSRRATADHDGHDGSGLTGLFRGCSLVIHSLPGEVCRA